MTRVVLPRAVLENPVYRFLWWRGGPVSLALIALEAVAFRLSGDWWWLVWLGLIPVVALLWIAAENTPFEPSTPKP